MVVRLTYRLVFHPSDPMSHVANVCDALQAAGKLKSVAVLNLLIDACNDSRIGIPAVTLADVVLALITDVDILVKCRAVPYHSPRNPVERVISIMNLAQQNCSLARARRKKHY